MPAQPTREGDPRSLHAPGDQRSTWACELRGLTEGRRRTRPRRRRRPATDRREDAGGHVTGPHSQSDGRTLGNQGALPEAPKLRMKRAAACRLASLTRPREMPLDEATCPGPGGTSGTPAKHRASSGRRRRGERRVIPLPRRAPHLRHDSKPSSSHRWLARSLKTTRARRLAPAERRRPSSAPSRRRPTATEAISHVVGILAEAQLARRRAERAVERVSEGPRAANPLGALALSGATVDVASRPAGPRSASLADPRAVTPTRESSSPLCE